MRSELLYLLLIISFLLISCGGGSGSNKVTGASNDDSIISLTWTPPDSRTNGELFLEEDLVGYRIYYSEDGLTMKYLTEVNNLSVTYYSLENMPPGKYFLAVTAVDKDKLESDFSEYVSIELTE